MSWVCWLLPHLSWACSDDNRAAERYHQMDFSSILTCGQHQVYEHQETAEPRASLSLQPKSHEKKTVPLEIYNKKKERKERNLASISAASASFVVHSALVFFSFFPLTYIWGAAPWICIIKEKGAANRKHQGERVRTSVCVRSRRGWSASSLGHCRPPFNFLRWAAAVLFFFFKELAGCFLRKRWDI